MRISVSNSVNCFSVFDLRRAPSRARLQALQLQCLCNRTLLCREAKNYTNWMCESAWEILKVLEIG